MLAALLNCVLSVSFQEVDGWINGGSDTDFSSRLIGNGDLNGGYLSYNLFWELVDRLQEKYPKFLGPSLIYGKSYESRDMKAFVLGENVHKDLNQVNKSLIFINSSHHAREAISLSMVFSIIVRELKELIKGVNPNYKRMGLIIMPVVNVDGVVLINKDYNANHDRRKNLRPTGCPDVTRGGVDLNRNYDIKFDSIPEFTLDPCGDETRGSGPFSEPEIMAVKNLTLSHPNIVSAINFHCWGNLWIHPYNYMRPLEQGGMQIDQPDLWKLYQNFHKMVTLAPGTKTGPARDLVGYSASGEASDWMATKLNIFAWSPELGSNNPATDEFYISPTLQREVIDAQYPVMKQFFGLHQMKVEVLNMSLAYDTVTVVLKNHGYSNGRVDLTIVSLLKSIEIRGVRANKGNDLVSIGGGTFALEFKRLEEQTIHVVLGDQPMQIKAVEISVEAFVEGIISTVEMSAELKQKVIVSTGTKRNDQKRWVLIVGVAVVILIVWMVYRNYKRRKAQGDKIPSRGHTIEISDSGPKTFDI